MVVAKVYLESGEKKSISLYFVFSLSREVCLICQPMSYHHVYVTNCIRRITPHCNILKSRIMSLISQFTTLNCYILYLGSSIDKLKPQDLRVIHDTILIVEIHFCHLKMSEKYE